MFRIGGNIDYGSGQNLDWSFPFFLIPAPACDADKHLAARFRGAVEKIAGFAGSVTGIADHNDSVEQFVETAARQRLRSSTVEIFDPVSADSSDNNIAPPYSREKRKRHILGQRMVFQLIGLAINAVALQQLAQSKERTERHCAEFTVSEPDGMVHPPEPTEYRRQKSESLSYAGCNITSAHGSSTAEPVRRSRRCGATLPCHRCRG